VNAINTAHRRAANDMRAAAHRLLASRLLAHHQHRHLQQWASPVCSMSSAVTASTYTGIRVRLPQQQQQQQQRRCCNSSSVGSGAVFLAGGGFRRSTSTGAAASSKHTRNVAARATSDEDEESMSITSTNNPYVKHCVKLREKARYRREQGRLLLVGSTIVRELAECGAPLRVASLLLQPGAPSPLPPAVRPERVVRISDAVARKISGLETVAADDAFVELDVTGQGPTCVAELRSAFGLPGVGSGSSSSGTMQQQQQPAEQRQQQQQQQHPAEQRQLRRLLALEAVQDPGNLGTLLRCAMAFGWCVMSDRLTGVGVRAPGMH